MRFPILLAGLLLAAAPAWAAPGLWQWQPVNMADMQPMSGDQLASHVGDWVYADDGSIVGSLQSTTGGVQLRVSKFFRPAGQALTVPAGDIVLAQGKLVIHGASYDDLAK